MSILIDDKYFQVKENNNNGHYRFIIIEGKPIGNIFRMWLTKDNPRISRYGYTVKEIRNALKYFKCSGIELAFETELWLAKGNKK